MANEGSHSLLGPLPALGGFVTGSWLIGLIAPRYPKSDTVDPVLAPVFATYATGMAVITALLFWLPTQAVLIRDRHADGFPGRRRPSGRRSGHLHGRDHIDAVLAALRGRHHQESEYSCHDTSCRRGPVDVSGTLSGAPLLNIGQTYAMTLPTTILLVTAAIYIIRAVRSSNNRRSACEQGSAQRLIAPGLTRDRSMPEERAHRPGRSELH